MEIKIYIKEKGKVIEKKITKKMICSMFDLQFMLNKNVWNTVKLNNMEKDIIGFFKIISYLDNKVHEIEVKRNKINDLEKKEALERLEKIYGAGLKRHKIVPTDEDLHRAREEAFEELAEELGVKLD